MNENNKLVPVAMVIVGLLIAGAIYYRPTAPPTDNNQAAVSQAEALKQAKASLTKMAFVSPTEHLLGSVEAPLILVEYSDLECPFCKAFHFAAQSLNEKYISTNQLAIVFRQFPLTIHSKAPTEAAGAECVSQLGDNNKFWQYLDKIFAATPSNNGLDLALLPKIAGDLGIDQTKFNACLNDNKTKSLIDDQIKKGLDIDVNGTPFIIALGPKGEKIMPFYEPIPATWSDTDKQIISDLTTAYQVEIDKLRSAPTK
jgi:protein-disulfide isomerase